MSDSITERKINEYIFKCFEKYQYKISIDGEVTKFFIIAAASSTGKITNYKLCFTNAGTNTETGRKERTQIPTSWGGDLLESA